MSLYILGVNAYHGDSSACLVKDGILLSAVEEERFRRIKHWAGFPSESIKYCLKEAGIGIGDIAHVAVNSDPNANFLKKLAYGFSQRPELSLIMDRLKNSKKRASVKESLNRAFKGCTFTGQVTRVEHHLSHMASAFLVSPFQKAAIVSVDGFGDFASASWGIGSGNDISIDQKVIFPHSLGAFYQALTQFIGFPHYGDEYKVMGLAPYGEPKYLPEMREIVDLTPDGSFALNMDYFVYHKEKVKYEWENTIPSVGRLFSDKLADLLGEPRGKSEDLAQRHKDIARSVQAMYEEAFTHILSHLHEKHNIDKLCLAGGCAANSVANGKILNTTPFKEVYIQSAAGDAGGAIGAAYTVWNRVSKSNNRFKMDHAYFGPSFNNDEIKQILDGYRNEIEKSSCSISYLEEDDDLYKLTAKAITEGKVIGWFQGRMEWGPRALGNRSILGDPRRSDMKDILNLKIKRRESFRPFAPSILREHVADWFEIDTDVPFMMQVFQIYAEKRDQIPAVTHVDGSGRLQTVHMNTNPRYYRLIEAFKNLTGVPILLNTSFNENEPVVCHPKEALDCFLRTKMDLLVLENYVVSRN